MSVLVIAFGPLTDLMGKLPVHCEAGDTDELQQVLENKYPALKERKFAIAVNREFVTSNTPLKENAEVALLPPSSGG